jgi:hypothetical protein
MKNKFNAEELESNFGIAQLKNACIQYIFNKKLGSVAKNLALLQNQCKPLQLGKLITLIGSVAKNIW